MVELLRLDQHLDPLLLLLFEVLDDRLMINEMLLVLAEVLRAHILDSAKLLIILIVDVAVAAVHLVSHVLHEQAQVVDLARQLLVEVLGRHLELLVRLELLLIVLARIVLSVLDLALLNVLDALDQVLLHLGQTVVRVVSRLRDLPVELLALSRQLVLLLIVVVVIGSVLDELLFDLLDLFLGHGEVVFIARLMLLELHEELFVLLVELFTRHI